MEEKKFDLNSLIGFILLGGIMMWWMYTNQPTPEELEAQKNATEQVEETPEETIIDTTELLFKIQIHYPLSRHNKD